MRCLAVLLMLVPLVARADDPKRGLDIYFVDVMGGAATLIVTPERESILIDSGWPGFHDRDPKRIVHALKDLAGCDHLDHLVTTHWHTDHYGGVEGLTKLVRIDRFWDRGLPEDGTSEDFPDGPKPDDPLGIAYRKASQGKRTALSAGERVPLKGDISLLVLASGGRVATPDDLRIMQPVANPLCADAPPDKPVDPSDNARSLAFKLTMGRFDFLDCGDLTWNVEKKLVCPVNLIGPIDLFQVTHHGMDISNHPTLVRSIAPTVAVMNNGPRKGGSPATVKLLKSIDSIQALYALHRNQAAGPEDNADPKLTANADPAGGELIHVHVEPDGGKFTVRVGAKGEAREFSCR
jgi:beta-lactamase superfamily II metal-dependent hydrolase